MYEGKNPIAIQSRNWMIDALFYLMEEQPYHKISIGAICKKADLSRQTFYNCFQEKDDIFRVYLKNHFAEISAKLIANNQFCMEDFINSYSGFFIENEKSLKLMIEHHLEHLILQEISVYISILVSKFSINEHPNKCKYGQAFLSGALTQILIYWIKDTNPISSDELSEILSNLLSEVPLR